MKSKSCAFTPPQDTPKSCTIPSSGSLLFGMVLVTASTGQRLPCRAPPGPEAFRRLLSTCSSACPQVTEVDPEHTTHTHTHGVQPTAQAAGHRNQTPLHEECFHPTWRSGTEPSSGEGQEGPAVRPKALSSSSRNIARMASGLAKCLQSPGLHTK